jgi:hypothetical protein
LALAIIVCPKISILPRCKFNTNKIEKKKEKTTLLNLFIEKLLLQSLLMKNYLYNIFTEKIIELEGFI